MLFHESLALTVTEAEEHDVHLVERQVGGKLQVRVAIETFMDIRHEVPGIALTIGKDNLGIGMINENTNKFAASIASGSQYSYLYLVAHVTHGLSFLVRVQAVVNFQRCRHYLDKAFSVVRGPTVVHFTIFAELRLREIVVTVYTHRLQGVRTGAAKK